MMSPMEAIIIGLIAGAWLFRSLLFR
jgi:hypothetical protein